MNELRDTCITISSSGQIDSLKVRVDPITFAAVNLPLC